MPKADAATPRPDGRRSFYVYLRPDLIRDLKKAALDEDRPAYELVEDAVTELLRARRGDGQAKKGS